MIEGSHMWRLGEPRQKAIVREDKTQFTPVRERVAGRPRAMSLGPNGRLSSMAKMPHIPLSDLGLEGLARW